MFKAPLRLLQTLLLLLAVTAASANPDRSPQAPAPDALVFAFQRQKDPRALKPTADEVAAWLSRELGTRVEVLIPASYGATVQGLVSGKVHIAYLSSVPLLLAREEAPVELLLAEERNGATSYSSVVLVRRESPYQRLEDLRGARMAWTGATSASGYVFPWARLVELGLVPTGQEPRDFFSSTIFAGGYDRALLAVANGQADACAVSDYVIEGPRADLYGTPEVRAQLRVLERIGGVPTHGIAARADLPQELRARVREALLKLSRERPDLLEDVYGTSQFVAADADAHVRGAAEALARTGLAAKGLVP